VDVRVLAATNEPIRERVEDGTFREDLFFRLGTVLLGLPPLRERGKDVLLIVGSLLDQFAKAHALPRVALSDEARERLLAHSWPGNVRELKNAIERSLLLSPDGELSIEELVPSVQRPSSQVAPIPFPASLREITTSVAHAMVKLCRGNRTAAARRLAISTRRLRRLLNGEDAPEQDRAFSSLPATRAL